MVEGPGATRNGRKVQSVVGLLIREVQIQPNNKSSTNTTGIVATKKLEGRRLDACFSVGKEVFLILGPICHNNDLDTDNVSKNKIALRFHFGMNGCLMVRKFNDSSKLAPWRKNDKSSNKCTFIFSRNVHELNSTDGSMVIEMVSSTWTVVSEFVARSKLSRLGSRDVCGAGPSFDSQAVFDSITEKRSKAMICDALLDQDRFPGVGNIIKIEGLHNSRVHPRRLIENLSQDELMLTILECRNYAMRWLSNGRAPTKKVYNQTKCGSCRTGRVRMVKMGTDLSRVTFWCESCQPFVVGASSTKPSLCSSNKENISNDECNKSSTILNNKRDIDKTQKMIPRACCPQHGSKTISLRRVRKNDSSNIHRLFRTCRVPGCQYFLWADIHLPLCGSCRCKTVLRISKTDRTGGRWFLSCSSSKGNSKKTSTTTQVCSFFQWATPSQLAPFDDGLSPLT